MEFTFLGTASGLPTRQRNVTALAVCGKSNRNWVLVDCGEGTQQQLLKTPLSLIKLSAICITHVHGDHCYGLPGLLASMAMSGRTHPIKLIAPPAIQTFLETVIATTDVHLNYEIEFIDVASLCRDAGGTPLDLPEFEIESVALSHRVPCHAFVLTEKDRGLKLDVDRLIEAGLPQGPLWGKLQGGESVTLENGTVLHAKDYYLPEEPAKKAIVGGDNDTPSLLVAAAKNVDVLVHEATYTAAVAEKVGPAPQHSCAKRVAKFAQSSEIPNLVLTHFSARFHEERDKPGSIAEVEQEAREYYKGQLHLANDFDVLRLDKNRVLQKVSETKPHTLESRQ